MFSKKSKSSILPLVSVLVPSYNSKNFLGECLNSILSQTYKNIEVIFVDDGSTDDSLLEARKYEKYGIRIISQNNRGQPAALNTAFGLAQGKYIQYLDADDVLHPQKIEIQVCRLLDTDPKSVATAAWARFQYNLSTAVFIPEKVWQDLTPVDWLIESWCGGGMMPDSAWLVPYDIVKSAGPWNESLRWASDGLDADFFTRAILLSEKCLFCPEAKCFYRSLPGTQSRIKTLTSLEASLKILFNTGAALLKKEDTPRTRKAFADNLQRFVFATYPDFQELVEQAESQIHRLGGSGLPFVAGPITTSISKCLGWKIAKRIRSLAG